MTRPMLKRAYIVVHESFVKASSKNCLRASVGVVFTALAYGAQDVAASGKIVSV